MTEVNTEKLELVQKEVEEFLYQNQEITVTSQEDYTRATDTLKVINGKIKKLEDKRVDWIKPLLEAKRKIDDDFKQAIRPLEDYVATVKTKMLDWYRVEQKRLDEEQKKLEAKAMEDAKKNKQSEVIVPIINDVKTHRGDLATATVSKKWMYKLLDENAVPREYLIVDEAKIKTAVKNGVRKIAGVEIYEDYAAPTIR